MEVIQICSFIVYLKKLESQLILSYKRREISDDFNVKRRPEDVYRDQKIIKYKSSLTSELDDMDKTNFYYQNYLIQVLSRYIGSFSYLYEYNSEDKSAEKTSSTSTGETTKSLVAKKFEKQKSLIGRRRRRVFGYF